MLILALLLVGGYTASLMATPSAIVEQYRGTSIPKLNAAARKYLMDGKSDSALMVYNVLLNNPDCEKYPTEWATACNNSGYIYFYDYSNYDRASQLWFKALEIIEKNNLDHAEITYLNIGNLFILMEDNEKALEWYKKGFDLASQAENYESLMIFYNNMMLAQFNEFGHANGMEEVNYDFSVVPDSVPLKAYCIYIQQAAKYLDKNQLGPAIQCLKTASERINSTFNPERYQAGVLTTSATLLQKAGRNREAIKLYLMVDSIAQSYHLYDYNISAKRELCQLYEDEGQPERSVQYLKRAYELNDSVFGNKFSNKVHTMATMAEIEKINEEMHQLNLKRQRQVAILWCVSIGAVIVLGFLVWVIVLYRREQKKNAALYQKNMEVINLEKASPAPAKYTSSALNDEVRTQLLQGIQQVIDSDQVFKPEFSMEVLVQSVGSNPSYVSQVINEAYGKSLSALVAEKRINEACRLISENPGKYTIETIAQSVGYRSRSSFNANFNRVTGLSPSEFQKSAIKQK